MRDVPSVDEDFYERIATDLREQMARLEPAVKEYERLRALLEMVSAEPGAQPLHIDAHGSGPPPVTGASRRRGEPRGYRASQVVSLLRAEPGLTRAELAERLGIRVGYLYQLLPDLRNKGFVRERDGAWYAE
jgi:CRP-like cAMP-binding protein